MAYCINTSAHPLTLREGFLNGITLQPGESREVGGLAEQIYRSGDGRPQSVVDRWGVPGLLVEGDPRCQDFIATTVAGLKSLADTELASRSIPGASTATRDGLRFRVALPASAAAHVAAIAAALESTTHLGPAALDVVVEG